MKTIPGSTFSSPMINSTALEKNKKTVKSPNERNIEVKPVIEENNGAPLQSNAKVGEKS